MSNTVYNLFILCLIHINTTITFNLHFSVILMMLISMSHKKFVSNNLFVIVA